MRIGVFDSGIGGLTVLKEFIKKHPHHQYFYFGDTANLPYGTKSKEELRILVDKIIHFLFTKDVDILIIACGTISANLYEELKQKYDIPIYDVINPMIAYLENSSYNTIGLMATKMTVQSKTFEKKCRKPFISKACPLLVPLIENGEYESDALEKSLVEYTLEFKDKVDCVILGCTHYPVLSDKIANILPNIPLLNMGTVLADSLNLEGHGKLEVRLYFSKINHTLIENIDRIIDCKYALEEIKDA